MHRSLLIAALAALVVGCGGNKEDPEGVIPEHQLKAMEKAENVEQTLLDADAARREEIDRQSE